MKEYQVRGTTPEPSRLVHVAERQFPGCIYRYDGDIFVRPDSPIVECLRISRTDESVCLEFATISHTVVAENQLDTEVRDAFQAKNALLRETTGRTVADRKQQMRHDVLPDGVTTEPETM